MKSHIIILIVLLALVLTTNAETPEDMIYTTIRYAYGCYRILDQHGFYGCSSRTRTGDVGTLFLVNSTADVSLIKQQEERMFIAVVPAHTFDSDTLTSLNSTKNVAGVITLGTKQLNGFFDPPEYFNAESSYPQASLTPAHHDKEYDWNPRGTGEIHKSFMWPMASVSGSEGKHIYDAAHENVLQYEQDGFMTYRAKMVYYNSGFRNTQYCLRDRTCLPIGGYNIISMIGAPEFHGTDIPWVFVPIPIDGRALFNRQTISAVDVQAGLIVAMAAARTLSQTYNASIGQQTPPKRIVFGLLAGERFSRVGSRSLLNDILLATPDPDDQEATPQYPCLVEVKGQTYPPFAKNETQAVRSCERPYKFNTSIYQSLQLKNLHSIIQMHSPVSRKLFLHTEKPVSADTQDVVDTILAISKDIEVLDTKNVIQVEPADATTPGIPPSSTQTFIGHDKEIPSVFMSSFDTEYSNIYQSTSFDDVSMLGDDKGYNLLCAYATLMTRSLLVISGSAPLTPTDGNEDELDIKTVSVDCQLILDLITCFNENLQCSLFGSLFNYSASKQNPMSFSPGTYRPVPSSAIINYNRLLYNWFYLAGYDAVVNSNQNGEDEDSNINDGKSIDTTLLSRSFQPMATTSSSKPGKYQRLFQDVVLPQLMDAEIASSPDGFHRQINENGRRMGVLDASVNQQQPETNTTGDRGDLGGKDVETSVSTNQVGDTTPDLATILLYSRFAYFHDALDPNVSLNYESNYFYINSQDNVDDLPPVYTESNWDRATKVTIYQVVDSTTMIIFGAVAAAVFALFLLIALCIHLRLKETYRYHRLDTDGANKDE